MSSMMEWNAKTPLQWEWENLIIFNQTAADNSRRIQQVEWEINGYGGIDSGSFFPSGVGDGSGGSSSDFGLTSLSKSSKSVSHSSSTGETKTSKSMLEAYNNVPENKDFGKAEPTGGFSTFEASVGSGEPLLSLKLGKRMYFEDISAGSNGKNSSLPAVGASSLTPAKRSKSDPQTKQAALCQVEGCGLDLSSAKDYHRKHRVCENHSKSPMVVVSGLERRFCQQCSRFHGLSDFDEKKRSCRRRLCDHNARRRKPQIDAVRLNSARLSSSIYDGKQSMTLLWGGVPLIQSNHSENSTWEGTCGFKSTHAKGDVSKFAEGRGTGGLLQLHGNQPPNSVPAHHYDSGGFLLSKTKAEVLNQGPEESMISFNLGATQDCHRALSLLSKNSQGKCESKQVLQQHPMSTSHTNMPHSLMPAGAQAWPFPSSEYRQVGKKSSELQSSPSSYHHEAGNYAQEIQLFRAPCKSDFYSTVD